MAKNAKPASVKKAPKSSPRGKRANGGDGRAASGRKALKSKVTKSRNSVGKASTKAAASPIKRVKETVSSTIGRVRQKLTRGATTASPAASPQRRTQTPARVTARQSRPIKRSTDIPMEQIDRAYTPSQTSMKTSFRADGNDHHSSQEFADGAGDDRWNDDDRLTNHSGDPRIGTHGRTYEPGEKVTRSRR